MPGRLVRHFLTQFVETDAGAGGASHQALAPGAAGVITIPLFATVFTSALAATKGRYYAVTDSIASMPTLTIRNVTESLKAALRVRAARHDRSMEEEVRHLLRQAVTADRAEAGLGSRIARRFAPS